MTWCAWWLTSAVAKVLRLSVDNWACMRVWGDGVGGWVITLFLSMQLLWNYKKPVVEIWCASSRWLEDDVLVFVIWPWLLKENCLKISWEANSTAASQQCAARLLCMVQMGLFQYTPWLHGIPKFALRIPVTTHHHRHHRPRNLLWHWSARAQQRIIVY